MGRGERRARAKAYGVYGRIHRSESWVVKGEKRDRGYLRKTRERWEK